ncbi:MAG: hypothetical protein AMXMBFR61_02220 [Fimbriimonadales bacterium]
MYLLPDGTALVQTVDFFTPIVDDPYLFGAIAAANALSDVYAMGGRPLTALNILCFPAGVAPPEVLSRILLGGYEKVNEAGAVVVGGHSVEDKEPKFGMAVTGIVNPGQAITNKDARPGQRIVLTKPLGTGVITTAAKFDSCPPDALEAACASMTRLNREASYAAVRHGVRTGTDITGFGLAGHLSHVARASGVGLRLEWERLPLLPEARRLAAEGHSPGGAMANHAWLDDILEFAPDVPEEMRKLVVDPQTSGGLALFVAPEHVDVLLAELPGAAEIGGAEEGPPRIFVV